MNKAYFSHRCLAIKPIYRMKLFLNKASVLFGIKKAKGSINQLFILHWTESIDANSTVKIIN